MTTIHNNGVVNSKFNTSKTQPKSDVVSAVADFIGRTAQKETASIKDGTIKGGDNDNFTLNNGKPGQSYDLLSDNNLSFRGMIDNETGAQDLEHDIGFLGMKFPAMSSPMDLGKTGITVSSQWDSEDSNFITFNKNGNATIDGQAMQNGKIYMLKDGGAAILNGTTLTVKTAEGYNITQEADALNDCVNVDVEPGANGVASDWTPPTGVLGQTFDPDKQVYTDAGVDLRDHETDRLKDGPSPFDDIFDLGPAPVMEERPNNAGQTPITGGLSKVVENPGDAILTGLTGGLNKFVEDPADAILTGATGGFNKVVEDPADAILTGATGGLNKFVEDPADAILTGATGGFNKIVEDPGDAILTFATGGLNKIFDGF